MGTYVRMPKNNTKLMNLQVFNSMSDLPTFPYNAGGGKVFRKLKSSEIRHKRHQLRKVLEKQNVKTIRGFALDQWQLRLGRGGKSVLVEKCLDGCMENNMELNSRYRIFYKFSVF